MNGIRMQKCSLKRQGITSLVLAVGLSAAIVEFRPDDAFAKAPIGKKWPASQLVSIDKIDHSGFDQLLKKYVDTDGFVNYTGWKKSTADRRALQDYLDRLGRADARKSSTREAKLAFWINAYNAVTLEGILQVYPTSSIRNHTARFVGYNIWKELPLRVGKKSYSLEQMEHQVLRKMGEPRIHFAIVCASIGCPRLRNEAYQANRIEEQLADNTRDFFGRSQNLRVDRKRKRLYFSSILDWFAEDFGSSQKERLAYLRPYLPEAARTLAANSRVQIKYQDYDWNLNDQSR